MSQEVLTTKTADYQLAVLPLDNKDWRTADKCEAVLTLQLEGEKRTFRGVITLTAIQKEARK
jgi:hypothetical protein